MEKYPWVYARTATFVRNLGQQDWPLDCGSGGPFSGMNVDSCLIDLDILGAAVVLPEEVQATSS